MTITSRSPTTVAAEAFPFVEEVGRARMKYACVKGSPPLGQRLRGSSAKPFGDPFTQGRAPAVFPRQVRDGGRV